MTANAGYTRFDTAPQLEITAAGLALRAPIFPDETFASGGVQVKVPLYTGGRISAQIGAAHQAALSADVTEVSARSSLRLGIAKAYVDVLRSQRMLEAAESSVASLRAHASLLDEAIALLALQRAIGKL